MFVINYKYEGASCEIKTFENEKIAIGKVYRAYADYLWISSAESLSSVEKYVDMFVKVEISHASLNSLTIMGNLSIGKHGDLKITDIDLLSENNQREFYRVLVMRDEKLNLIDKSGMVNMQFKTKIIDMSLGGALIESVLQLPVGRVANLEIELEEGVVMPLKGVIIRKFDSPENRHRYGVKFQEFEQHNELIALGLYLFKVQEENDKKGLN